MSVICMREPSSLVCTCTAKMLTWLVSMSAAIGAGSSTRGRGATSSSTNARNDAPTSAISRARLAAISRQVWSVMSVTFSAGSMARQTRTAFRAPGVSSGSNGWFRRLDVMQPELRLVRHVLDHLPQVVRLLEHAELAIGPGAVPQDLMDVIDFLTRIQLIDDVVDELEVFEDQIPLGHLFLAAEIDEHAVEAVSRCPPLVLHDERPAVLTEALVFRMEAVQL